MPDARMALYAGGVEIYLAPNADSRDSWQGTPNHILPFTLNPPLPLHSTMKRIVFQNSYHSAYCMRGPMLCVELQSALHQEGLP